MNHPDNSTKQAVIKILGEQHAGLQRATHRCQLITVCGVSNRFTGVADFSQQGKLLLAVAFGLLENQLAVEIDPARVHQMGTVFGGVAVHHQLVSEFGFAFLESFAR